MPLNCRIWWSVDLCWQWSSSCVLFFSLYLSHPPLTPSFSLSLSLSPSLSPSCSSFSRQQWYVPTRDAPPYGAASRGQSHCMGTVPGESHTLHSTSTTHCILYSIYINPYSSSIFYLYYYMINDTVYLDLTLPFTNSSNSCLSTLNSKRMEAISTNFASESTSFSTYLFLRRDRPWSSTR